MAGNADYLPTPESPDMHTVRLRLLTQAGQGPAICLVGFTLLPKAALKLAIP